MTVGLDSDQQAAAIAPNRVVVPLLELHFDSGTLYLALGGLAYTEGGNTYIHTGGLASIGPAKDSSISQQGLVMTMTGLDAAIVTLATEEDWSGRIAILRKAYLNPDAGYAPIGTSKRKFIGRMRQMVINDDTTQASISITAEHYEIELTRARPLRYTDADQQRLYPGDKGCEYAAIIPTRQVVFPSKEAQGG